MATSKNRTGLLIAAGGILLLAIAGILIANHFRSGGTPQNNQTTAVTQPQAAVTPANPADRMWNVMGGLARLDQHGSDIPPDKTPAELAQAFGTDPDKLLAAIQKQVSLVPYEGSLAEPAQILESGMGNSLDRARLLRTLLVALGNQARIVSARQDGKSVLGTYAFSSHVALPQVRPEVLAAVQKEVAVLPPAILAKLSSGLNLATDIAGAKPEQRVYWVQYQSSGQWKDLIPGDMQVESSQRSGAQVLSDSAESSLTWQIKLSVINRLTGDSPGKGKEVLSYSARASDLNAVPVTFINRPDGSLTKFVPTLLVGDKKTEGTGFAWNDGGKELVKQVIKIDVIGPTEARHFVRVLVGERGSASEAERGLEIATSARVTILTGIVSDALFERLIAGNLSHTAKVLIHPPAQDQNPEPSNASSIPTIAILDASHRYAGQLGDTSKQVLAFQARPAVALDRDFVALSGDSLTRSHSFDLIDPGHSLFGINVSNEILLRAAVEQSAVDALLEDWMASGKSVTTSRRVVNDLLAAGADFTSKKSSSAPPADDSGKSRSLYRMGLNTQNGTRAGWRIDPGPQVVSILGDGSGGTQSTNEQMARVQTLCTGLSWGAMLVPAEFLPPTFLLGGIVKYDCELAKAYNKAANVIDGLASQIGGTPAPSPTSPDDLAKQIKEMTDGLINDIVKGSIGSAVGGLGIRGVGQVAPPIVTSILNPLSGAAGDYIVSKIAEALNKEFLSDAEVASIKDAVQTAQKLQQAGSTPDQIQQALQNHGH